jgi:hypothetical protein
MNWHAGLMHGWSRNEITLKSELFLLQGIINVLWTESAAMKYTFYITFLDVISMFHTLTIFVTVTYKQYFICDWHKCL